MASLHALTKALVIFLIALKAVDGLQCNFNGLCDGICYQLCPIISLFFMQWAKRAKHAPVSVVFVQWIRLYLV